MIKKQENRLGKYYKKLISNRIRCMNCGNEMNLMILSDIDKNYDTTNPYIITHRYIYRKAAEYYKALKNKKAKLKPRRRGITIPVSKRMIYRIFCACHKCGKNQSFRHCVSNDT